MNTNRNLKVVVTGGPGGGKTTAIDLFRRELVDQLTVVPEAATVLFSSGIQRVTPRPEVTMAIQKTIFGLQKNIEEIISCQNPNKLLVCDRGTLDGLAYWPESEKSFFEQMGTTLQNELARYDAVIFFQTAAASGHDITSNNPYRNEDSQRAIELDEKLQKIWSQHHNFSLVKCNESFIKKIMFGIMTIENVINSM